MGYFTDLKDAEKEVVEIATLRILKIFLRISKLPLDDKWRAEKLVDSIQKRLELKYKFL